MLSATMKSRDPGPALAYSDTGVTLFLPGTIKKT